MMLQGYRTYVCVGLAVVVLGLQATGLITADTARQVLELLGFGGLAALRSALNR
jgi:hypothetical protein